MIGIYVPTLIVHVELCPSSPHALKVPARTPLLLPDIIQQLGFSFNGTGQAVPTGVNNLIRGDPCHRVRVLGLPAEGY